MGTFIETFNRHRRVLRTRRARIVRSKTQRHDAMMSFARAPQHASVFFTGTKMNASRRHSSETSSTSSSSSSSSSNRRAVFGETETEPGGFSQRLGSNHGFRGFDETGDVATGVCGNPHDRRRVHGETGGGLVCHRLGSEEEYDSNRRRN